MVRESFLLRNMPILSLGFYYTPQGAIARYWIALAAVEHCSRGYHVNRIEGGSRKYIIVEQADYLKTVIKPRIQKVVYSARLEGWQTDRTADGICHAFKVVKIESYEDTLNNLQLRRTAEQEHLFDKLPQHAQDDYLLHYCWTSRAEARCCPWRTSRSPLITS